MVLREQLTGAVSYGEEPTVHRGSENLDNIFVYQNSANPYSQLVVVQPQARCAGVRLVALTALPDKFVAEQLLPKVEVRPLNQDVGRSVFYSRRRKDEIYPFPAEKYDLYEICD